MVKHLARWVWLASAYVFLALAIVGVFLPGLPTTPFVLLAAWAATRGSRRLHEWLLTHRAFGPMIRDWQAQGAVSRRAKIWAVSTMALCALIFFLTAPRWWMAATGSAIMAVVAVWLVSRPEPR